MNYSLFKTDDGKDSNFNMGLICLTDSANCIIKAVFYGRWRWRIAPVYSIVQVCDATGDAMNS
ncbi:hypothetical protein BH11BAC6_BH11BAC6_02100 [soil metagenome]